MLKRRSRAGAARHDDHWQQVGAGPGDRRQSLVHGVQQHVLPEQVVDGVPGEGELGEHRDRYPESDRRRLTSTTLSALRIGSAMWTSAVQAATRANPCAYSDWNLMPPSSPDLARAVGRPSRFPSTSVGRFDPDTFRA